MKITIVTIVAALGAWNVAASAQVAAPSSESSMTSDSSLDAAGQGENLNEVVVTAQKFAQRAFDVPISLAVISASDLQTGLVRSLDDLVAVAPGVSAVDTGTGFRIAIRGISNVEGQGALVGTYLDDADVTTEESLAINLYTYDLQRVEVLRGPQGTLYGEGSIGGTIRYITNKPILNREQLGVDATATLDQYGAPGEQIIAVMNAPIVSNSLGLRVAADIDHEGGWMDQPAANQKNVNGRDIADVRIEGLWRLGSDFTVNAMQVIHRGSEGPFVGESSPGVYTQVFGLTTTTHLQDDYDLSNVTMEWDGYAVEVLNSATYFRHNLNEVNPGYAFQLAPPPSPPFDEYIPQVRPNDESLSDELRIQSNNDGRVHWVVGGFYRRFTDSTPPYLYYFDLPGPQGAGLPAPLGPDGTDTSVQSKSLSFFGDASYRLVNRLTVGAGVRQFRDDEHFLTSGSPTESGTFTSTDPRFYIQYGISKNINVYASAAKGFRSGGFNGYGLQAYGPENVWTYEFGSKVRLADNGLTADGDVFWSNYDGYQNIGILPPSTDYITRNAGTARIKGVEADVKWSPTAGWKLGLTGDYIDGRYIKINVTQSSYNQGDPLDMVSRYQITASGERDFPWNGKASFARVEYSQTARQTFRDRSIGDFYYGQSDYLYLLNFRAGVQWSRELSCAAFVQNLLNDRGYTGPFVIENNAARLQPRTFGVEFSWSME